MSPTLRDLGIVASDQASSKSQGLGGLLSINMAASWTTCYPQFGIYLWLEDVHEQRDPGHYTINNCHEASWILTCNATKKRTNKKRSAVPRFMLDFILVIGWTYGSNGPLLPRI